MINKVHREVWCLSLQEVRGQVFLNLEALARHLDLLILAVGRASLIVKPEDLVGCQLIVLAT